MVQGDSLARDGKKQVYFGNKGFGIPKKNVIGSSSFSSFNFFKIRNSFKPVTFKLFAENWSQWYQRGRCDPERALWVREGAELGPTGE